MTSIGRFILVGAPGSGKGTQSPAIVENFGVCHIATGDALRAAMAAGTEAGKAAKDAVNSGKLVSDDIVTKIVADAIEEPQCKGGFVLDGFPRTENQANILDKMLANKGQSIDKVVSIEVPKETLIERLSGRWIHKKSGRSYHTVFNPPKAAKVDDVTGEALEQRPDDKPETAVSRLATFDSDTKPVLSHYGALNKVVTIDGNRNMTTVACDVGRVLGAAIQTKSSSA
eukprot:TRINITY_DN4798_c0_g1_i1.p1 TRINITY_DN4798_c0_g1~~TRINITY_DN4798_c0_g1_i1.p1  ORF type:complete len:228 (+),score=83.96 TRINITY_DN4798_c0_g1_i1:64-747(+)